MQYRRLLTFATRIETRGLSRLEEGPTSRSRFFSLTSRMFDEPKGTSRRSFDPAASFRITDSPNPNWKLGRGLPENIEPGKSWKAEEEKGWKTWNLLDTAPREVYPLLTSCIVPRPIALVSTISEDGVPNLAPFSYFSMVSHNPPLLSISFSMSPRPKDSKENILATKEFTVSMISEPFIEAANIASVDAPADVDEWDSISGLTKAPSIDVQPPWVKESAIGLECELFHSYDIRLPNSGEITHTLVLGLIKRAHVRESILTENGTVDPGKLRVVSRLGGSTYARIGEGFELPRPTWKAIRDGVPSGSLG